MKCTINFSDMECEVIERYEVSEEFATEHNLVYKKRIKFVTPNGFVHDCADTWPTKLWKIWGNAIYELEVLYIYADSFDEAMARARVFDKRYNAGQIIPLIDIRRKEG